MATTGTPVTRTPRLGRWTIDPGRSSITFRGRHFFGLLPVNGTFAIRDGTVDVAEPLAESALRVAVDAASFRTGNARRDAHVRSATFLDTGRHPLITFVSDAVDTAAVSGTLTVCGVARPVRLVIAHSAVSARTFGVRATTRIDRRDFGLTASRLLTGQRFDLTLEVTCVRH